MFSFYFFAVLCMCSGVAPSYTPTTAKSRDVGTSPFFIDPDPSSSNLQDASKNFAVKTKDSGVNALPVSDSTTAVPLDSRIAASISTVAQPSLKTNMEPMTTTEELGPLPLYSAVYFVIASLVIMPIGNIIIRLLRIKNKNVVAGCLTYFLFTGSVLVLTLIAYAQENFSGPNPNDRTPVTIFLLEPLGTAWLIATSLSFFLGTFGPFSFCCRNCRFLSFIARFSGDTGVVLAYIAEYAYGFTKTLSFEGEAMFVVQLDNKDIVILAFTYLLIKETLDYAFPRPSHNFAAVAPDPDGNVLPSTSYFDPDELTEILITESKDIGNPRPRISRGPSTPAYPPPSDNADLHHHSTNSQSKISILPATQVPLPNITPALSACSSTSRPPSSTSCCDPTPTPLNLDTWSSLPTPLHPSSLLRDLRFESFTAPVLYTPPPLKNMKNPSRPTSPCSPRSSTAPSSSPSSCSSCHTPTPPTSACPSRSCSPLAPYFNLQQSTPFSSSAFAAVSPPVRPSRRDSSRSRLGSWVKLTGRGDLSCDLAGKSQAASPCDSKNKSGSKVSCSSRPSSAPLPPASYDIGQPENVHSSRPVTVPPEPETYNDPAFWSLSQASSLASSEIESDDDSATPPRIPRRRSGSFRSRRRRSEHFKYPHVLQKFSSPGRRHYQPGELPEFTPLQMPVIPPGQEPENFTEFEALFSDYEEWN